MATAPVPAATAEAAEAPVAKGGGKKKLMIIIGAVVLLVLIGGGVAGYLVMQQRKAAAAAAAEAGEDVQEAKEPKKKGDKKSPPVFLPLEIFTVNLADREAERYAQVGITLELANNSVSDKLKAYMPAIRNDILMLLAHKKAEELQEREGKVVLAREVKRVASKPLVDDDSHGKNEGGDDEDEPVRAVHFSAFIIQ